ncbi:MAG: universal stress protein [Pseudomonadota bacterium]
MIKHIMLTLLSHPDPTPDWALRAADALAVHLDAQLCAALAVVTIPDVSTPLARRLVGADAAIAAENRYSLDNADKLATRFSALIGSSDAHRLARILSGHIVDPNPIASHARLFDLALLPAYGHPDTRWLIEGLLFNSGRPVLILPERPAYRWDHIIIGWDGSRAAARAIADALPLCRRARTVEIVTVTGEKALPSDLALDDVIHHLSCHQVSATGQMIPGDEDGAGQALLTHARRQAADLLVMGGFGHSRMREFFLGGATETVLHAPNLPILMSN